MPPGYEGFEHYHDTQDELYFVHSGTARFEIDGEVQELGPGGLVHVESTTPRKFSNAGDDDLVVLVIGAKDGYVERDGHLVDPDRDLERRKEFGTGAPRPLPSSRPASPPATSRPRSTSSAPSAR